MKTAKIAVISLVSLVSLASLGEGTQATEATKVTQVTEATNSAPQARRARPPRERRREGAIPGIVTIPYGKTASGERAHIYRIMGHGGVVADFTDYGARLVRLYTPDGTADLANILEGFLPSVIDCEKAGDVADVWKMTPIRRPRATGLVFEREGTKGTEGTSSSITYWLDASNTIMIEYKTADTNAVQRASSLKLAPLKGRALAVAGSLGSLTYANTTNSVALTLWPGTNATDKATLRLEPKN